MAEEAKKTQYTAEVCVPAADRQPVAFPFGAASVGVSDTFSQTSELFEQLEEKKTEQNTCVETLQKIGAQEGRRQSINDQLVILKKQKA